MNDSYDIEIERYLDGEMTESEMRDFEHRLATDRNLSESYGAMVTARKLITQAGRLELKEKLESFEEEPARKSSIKPLWVKRAFPIAAMLIIFFGVYQWLIFNNGISGDEVYTNYYETYKAPSVIRDTGTNELTNWKRATEYYRKQEHEEAIVYFSKAEKEIPQYLVAFYTGMSMLEVEAPDYQAALNNFETVLQSDNDYTQQATWYKGLLLLKLGKNEEAISVFENIVEAQTYHYQKAEEILKKKIKD